MARIYLELYKVNKECFAFVQWKEYFHSLKDGKVPVSSAYASFNGTFHLSTHENILTIELINIHYLYNVEENGS